MHFSQLEECKYRTPSHFCMRRTLILILFHRIMIHSQTHFAEFNNKGNPPPKRLIYRQSIVNSFSADYKYAHTFYYPNCLNFSSYSLEVRIKFEYSYNSVMCWNSHFVFVLITSTVLFDPPTWALNRSRECHNRTEARFPNWLKFICPTLRVHPLLLLLWSECGHWQGHCEKSACYKINTQFCTVEGKRVDLKIKGVVSCMWARAVLRMTETFIHVAGWWLGWN